MHGQGNIQGQDPPIESAANPSIIYQQSPNQERSQPNVEFSRAKKEEEVSGSKIVGLGASPGVDNGGQY